MPEDAKVNWEKVQRAVERGITEVLDKELGKQMKDDYADPGGGFIISYCEGGIKKAAEDLIPSLIEAWCK